MLTNSDILKLFKEKYPDIKVSDYRQLNWLYVDSKIGITIWTDNGDMILYFPKISNEKWLSERKLEEKARFLTTICRDSITQSGGKHKTTYDQDFEYWKNWLSEDHKYIQMENTK